MIAPPVEDQAHPYHTVNHPFDQRSPPHIHKLLSQYDRIQLASCINHHPAQVLLYHPVFPVVRSHPAALTSPATWSLYHPGASHIPIFPLGEAIVRRSATPLTPS